MTEKNLSLKLIHVHVSDFFKVDMNFIFQNNRVRDVIEKRQIFYYLCRKYAPRKALREISNYCMLSGYKLPNHATILHGVKKVNNMIDTERFYASEILRIEQDLNSLTEHLRNLEKGSIIDSSIKKILITELFECPSLEDMLNVLNNYLENFEGKKINNIETSYEKVSA